MPVSIDMIRAELARLPPETQMDHWVGPKLFTRAVTDDDNGLETLAHLRADLAEHPMRETLVLGTQQEHLGDEIHVYAAYCLDPQHCEVSYIALRPPYSAQLVNRSLRQFVDSVAVMRDALPQFACDDEAWPIVRRRAVDALTAIDPDAMGDDDFWPAAIASYACEY